MFNIGGGELLVIALIALIVLGPQRLPDAARQIGKTMGELRRMSSGFQQELRSALDEPDKRTIPPRDVLGAGDAAPPAADAVSAAVNAVNEQPTAAGPSRPRRTPLRAEAQAKAARTSTPTPRRAAPIKATGGSAAVNGAPAKTTAKAPRKAAGKSSGTGRAVPQAGRRRSTPR